MNITVKLLGTLREYSHPDTPGQLHVDLPENTTVAQMVEQIIQRRAPVVACAINGHTRKLDAVLSDGDEVFLLSKLGGG